MPSTTVLIAQAKPLSGGVNVLLMGVAVIARETVAPQRRINLHYC